MEKKHNDWGFSSQVDPSQHAVKSVNLTAVNLTQIDFPSWLNALEPKDARILMKLDVEGSEFELLTALLFRGQLCNRIHTMTLEWHPRQCQRKWCAIKDKLPPILDMARSVKCSTRFLAMDDESYEDDRVSLHRGHSTGRGVVHGRESVSLAPRVLPHPWAPSQGAAARRT
jgi:hypothetical protein